MGKIGDDFEFHTKKLFWSPSFFIYRWFVPLVVKNSVLTSKFISLIFHSFFVRGERQRTIEFLCTEKKLSLTMMMITATKIVETIVNEFYFMRKVSHGCLFLFSLPEEANLTIRIFFLLFSSFLDFFFDAMDRIIMVFWVFFKYFE